MTTAGYQGHHVPAHPCLTYRLFFPAGGDAKQAAQHDLATINQHPEWTLLNYVSRPDEGKGPDKLSEGWYDQTRYQPNKCTKIPDRKAEQCDEYPPYSSAQSNATTSSLKPVKKKENEAEGSKYGVMVQDPNCAMVSGGPVARAQQEKQGTPFLVIPLPRVPVDTFHVCTAEVFPT